MILPPRLVPVESAEPVSWPIEAYAADPAGSCPPLNTAKTAIGVFEAPERFCAWSVGGNVVLAAAGSAVGFEGVFGYADEPCKQLGSS